MILYGLIGYPLAHSASARLFADKFAREGIRDRQYLLFPLEDISILPRLISDQPLLCGLNVTIPYKEKILPYLDELDETAAGIGAVNTVVVRRAASGLKLSGFNTDESGFRESADFSGHSKALVLGTGGAAKAVAFALRKKGIQPVFVSRHATSPDILEYSGLTPGIVHEHTLIINATPLGMSPMTGSCPPLPYEALTQRHFLYDLVYNPDITEFMKQGIAAGCRVQNGWRMLQLQAEKAYEIWNS